MKKLFLFAASLLVAVNMMAVVDYGLQIAGVDVTDENAANITGTDISGKVSYDPTTKTLSLEDATIMGDIWVHPTYVADDEINISIKGECVVDNSGKPGTAIYSQVDHTSIIAVETWVSNLTVVAETESAIKCYNGSHGGDKELKIKELTLHAESSNDYAIQAGSVDVTNSIVELFAADDKSAIKYGTVHLTLSECDIVYYVHDFTYPPVADGCRMAIAPELALTEREILVNGKKINNFTVLDIFQDGHGFGRYDEATGNIIVENFTGNPLDFTQVDPAIPLLEFQKPSKLIFQSHDNAIGFYGQIKTNSNLTISGQTTNIQFLSAYEPAIALVATPNDITLTFEKASNITVDGDVYSIKRSDLSGAQATVAFNASDVTINNRIIASNLLFEKCNLVDGFGDPIANWLLDATQGLVDPDTWISGDELYGTEIRPAEIRSEVFPIEVLGGAVTGANCGDILGDGMLSYDHATKTLTIADQANISTTWTGIPVVKAKNTDLNIVFLGEVVNFFADAAPAIVMDGTGHKLTIRGDKTGVGFSIASRNTDDLPAISAAGNDVEFLGRSGIMVEQQDADAPVIAARDITVNCQLDVFNYAATLTHDVFSASGNVSYNSKLEMSSTSDVELVSGQVQWVVASSDPIAYLYFQPEYLHLTVLGMSVNAMNMDDFFGDGSLVVEKTTGGLIATLDNVTIEATAGLNAIFCDDEDLILKVKGNNVLSSEGAEALVVQNGNLQIIGEGTKPFMRIEAVGNFMVQNVSAVVLANADNKFTVKDASVNAISRESYNWAIYLEPGTTSTLRVDNANLRASTVDPLGAENGINHINALEMVNGVDFRTDNAEWPLITWNSSDGFKRVDESADLSHIWIGLDEAFPTSIENTIAPTESAQKVLINGQLFIIRGNYIYDVTGKMVR